MSGKIFAACLLVSAFLIYLSVLGGTVIHEVLHIHTQDLYKCINNTIEIDYVTLNGKAICYEYLPRSDEEVYYERFQHAMNDAVGYNNQTIELLLGFILMCLVIITFKEK